MSTLTQTLEIPIKIPEQNLVVVHSNGRQSVGRVGSVGSVGSVGKNYKYYLHHYYTGLPKISE